MATLTAIQRFRTRLEDGEYLIGASVTFNDALVTDALADSVDFLWIDTEHTTMSRQTMGEHLLACRAHARPGLVRVPVGYTGFIKPALDGGADGIIVPQVRSVAEVQAIVDDCRYPPQGRRGSGPRVPTNYGRREPVEFVRTANAGVFVAVQIENQEALAVVEEIVRVPGLDAVCIGPWDLSAGLGVFGEVTGERVLSAVDRVVAAARGAGLTVGAGMGNDASYAHEMARRGVQWLQVGSDYSYMLESIDGLVQRCRAGFETD